MKTTFNLDIEETASLYQRLEKLKRFSNVIKTEIKLTEEAIKKEQDAQPNQMNLITEIEKTNADTSETSDKK